MKTIAMIAALVFACVVLACLTVFMPAVAGAALPYASFALSLGVCLLCAVLLAKQFVHRS